jgi:hypothetical protein
MHLEQGTGAGYGEEDMAVRFLRSSRAEGKI